MTIQRFTELMRELDLEVEKAVYIEYWGSGIRFARGQFLEINHDYVQRIKWWDFDSRKERSLCHRNIRRIEAYDWGILW